MFKWLPLKGKITEQSKLLNSINEFGGNNSFTDTTFRRGIHYTYAVKAIGIEHSESSPGNEVAFYIAKITPYPPSGLRAFSTGTGIMLQWDSPLAEQIKTYKIYREKLGGKPKLIAELGPEKTDYSDKLTKKAESYFYTISIVNSEGLESVKSDEVGINY